MIDHIPVLTEKMKILAVFKSGFEICNILSCTDNSKNVSICGNSFRELGSGSCTGVKKSNLRLKSAVSHQYVRRLGKKSCKQVRFNLSSSGDSFDADKTFTVTRSNKSNAKSSASIVIVSSRFIERIYTLDILSVS